LACEHISAEEIEKIEEQTCHQDMYGFYMRPGKPGDFGESAHPSRNIEASGNATLMATDEGPEASDESFAGADFAGSF